jgi:AAA15 family ATPase/GTPase
MLQATQNIKISKMNIKEIIKKDLPKFTGICVREGYVELEKIKRFKVAMAYLFNKNKAKNYIGKQILVAGSRKNRGKYFTAKIMNILSVRELWENPKYRDAINFYEKIFGKWISDRITNKVNDGVIDKRMAVIFDTPSEIESFNTNWVSFSRPSFYYIHASQKDIIIEGENDLFRITKLSINNFLNFTQINENFSPGINIIIGENNIGKTAFIKFLYANLKAIEEYLNLKGKPGERNFKELLSHKVQKTFQSSERIGTIVCKTSDSELKSLITFDYGEEKEIKEIEFSFKKTTKTEIPNLVPLIVKEHENIPEFNTTFIPAKEILSISDAIKVAMKEYEVGFDATYEDLLSDIEPPFKKEEDYDNKILKEVIMTIQNEILDGEIIYDNDSRKYYYKDNTGNKFDLTMTAEGVKQLGTIPTLIKTGKITQGTILFLDEPDNNLNPVALKKLVDILIKLANAGVQIFLTTHNHLLSQLISLYGEYKDTLIKQKEQIPEMKFFALYKNEQGKTEIETANELIDITNNSILDEFVKLHDQEELFYQRSQNL